MTTGPDGVECWMLLILDARSECLKLQRWCEVLLISGLFLQLFLGMAEIGWI